MKPAQYGKEFLEEKDRSLTLLACCKWTPSSSYLKVIWIGGGGSSARLMQARCCLQLEKGNPRQMLWEGRLN